jgi:hypothetical protein
MAGPDDEPTFLGALRVTNGALSSSFRLDVGCLDHLGPFHEFELDVLGELFRGARDRFEAKYSKPLLRSACVRICRDGRRTPASSRGCRMSAISGRRRFALQDSHPGLGPFADRARPLGPVVRFRVPAGPLFQLHFDEFQRRGPGIGE